MSINGLNQRKALLVLSGLLFSFCISADAFIHNDFPDENSIECHICSNDVTESTIEINNIDAVANELSKNITAASLLDSQFSTSYSTRAPPKI